MSDMFPVTSAAEQGHVESIIPILADMSRGERDVNEFPQRVFYHIAVMDKPPIPSICFIEPDFIYGFTH